MRLFLAGLTALALLTTGCQKEATLPAPTTVQSRILGRLWLESYEEEQPGTNTKVFRTQTYAFAVSRPRFGFQFDAGNVFTGYQASPTDGQTTVPGRWLTTGPDLFRITPNHEPSTYTLHLISVQDDVLRVQILP
ncbi:hypothetical protein [Hymenobacter algoricola]|uniref:Lipocalin-like domain-containing protein n=1 Tax=Hymenobacter algoricola TaxID=486267 RepID=A0ABP7NUY0_9BACT